MKITYDMLASAFLSKVTEFEFLKLPETGRDEAISGYMKRAVSNFRKNCKYDLTKYDDEIREFPTDIPPEDVNELVEIISEGMLVQWMKPYVYKQELLESVLNTNDFTTYSPAELLYRVSEAYHSVQKDYTQMIREYSYNHGDLWRLHI